MKLATRNRSQPMPSGKTHLSLSKDEKNTLEVEFLKELEKEHIERERRAKEKIERSSSRKTHDRRQSEKEVAALKTEMRRQFYTERGYKQSKDPTGRIMWLSPTEQQSHNRRKGRRKKSRIKKNLIEYKSTILLYSSIMALAVMLALYIVKS